MQYHSSTKNRFKIIIEDAYKKVQYRPNLEGIKNALKLTLNNSDVPIKVAIVGKIKAGKSTFVNCLLGENIVTTGVSENTFNVTILKYDTFAHATVHYKNGEPLNISLDDLPKYIQRDAEHLDILKSIDKVEIFYPNEILKTIEIIDTPGFASVYEVDSENTSRYLIEKSNEVTKYHSSNCDAALYFFRLGMSAYDKETITDIGLNSFGKSPRLNTLGVFTRIDESWHIESNPFPLIKSREIATNAMEKFVELQSLLYDIVPVSSIIALGSQTLEDEDFDILRTMSTYELDFEWIIGNKKRFFSLESPKFPVDPALRQKVLSKLDLYGVWLSVRYIIENPECCLSDLKEFLLSQSGFDVLKARIIDHFGNRSYLLKIRNDLHNLIRFCMNKSFNLDGADKKIAEEVSSTLDSFLCNIHELNELEIISELYSLEVMDDDPRLQLPAGALQDFLHVTGERGGISLNNRLRLPENSTLNEKIKMAKDRIAFWKSVSLDTAEISNLTKRMSNTAILSYENILHKIQNDYR